MLGDELLGSRGERKAQPVARAAWCAASLGPWAAPWPTAWWLPTQFQSPNSRVNHYLISFPASAMGHISDDDLPSVGHSAHAVIREAKVAGVYVFGGGIDETVPPVMVSGEGKVTPGTYAETTNFNGGFCVLRVASREEAEAWAAKIAAACRCAQELREFMFDPES